MIRVIKERIKQIQRGEVPTGYLKTKRGILPTDWENVKIGECLQRVENPVQVEPDTMYTQIGIRSHGKGLFYKDPVMGRELKHKAVFWIEPDCFILNIVFAWEQAVGKTTSREKGMIGSHRFPMYWPVNHKVDIDYLIAYFLTKRGTEILGEASPGGAGRNRTLGQESFLKSTIVLPPIEEQEKIAKILMTQDQVITLKERYLVEKEKQKKYLMQVLLTGEKRLPGFSGVWKAVRFSDIFTFGSTNSFARQYMSLQGEGIKNIHYGDILIKYDEIVDAGKEFIPVLLPNVNLGQNEFLSDGDIVIADTAEDLTAGKVIEIQNVGTQKIVAGMHTMLCKPKKNLFAPRWLGFYMNSSHYHKRLIPYIAGIKVMSISKGNIANTHILVPPIKEQRAIVEVLSMVDKEISLLRRELEEERQKKKALMQLLLSGIVRMV